MTIRKLLTLTVCTALLGCSDDPEQTQQVPPTTGFGNRLSGLTATIPGADVTDKSSTTRTGADETGATVWLVDDAITVTDGRHAGTFDVATGIGTATGKFNGSLDFEQTPLYAVYPAVSAMNGFIAPIVISTMQNARTAGANNIMTARCEEVKAASESQFVFRKKAATAQLSFDFTSEEKYASEKVNSIKITAEGVNFAGACDFDLTDPDAQLRGSSNSITYTFNEAPSLADKIEFTIGLAPCDLTQLVRRPEEIYTGADTEHVYIQLILSDDDAPLYFNYQNDLGQGDTLADDAVAQYCALLGLDEFTDWQYPDWGTAVRDFGAAGYSETAQVYAVANASGYSVTLSAASMTPQTFAALNTQYGEEIS